MNRVRTILGLLLALAVVAAYSNCFSGIFIFDDYVSVLNNWRIRSFERCFLDTTRPLTNVSFYLNYVTGGLRAADCHAVNLSIHVAAVLVFFGLLWRTLLLPRFGKIFNASAVFVAFFAALLWGVHPLQSESVTYICQRSESMMGLFYLVTIYSIVRSATGSNAIVWQSIAIISCLLGMASKPVMVTAPLVALLFDRAFISGSVKEALRARGRLYAGLVIAVLIPACMLLMPNESNTSAGFAFDGISPIAYFLSQQGVVLHYLRLAIFPHPLCLDYGWQPADSLLQLLIPSLVVSALLAMTLVASLKKWRAGFAGVWFFLILAPGSSFIPVADLAFEHRMYLPLASIIVLGVALVEFACIILTSSGRITLFRARMFAGLCMLSMALALGVLTFLRNKDYSSEERMWVSCLGVNSSNMRLYASLGGIYAAQGRYSEAQKAFDRVREVAGRGVYRDSTVLSIVACNMGTMRLAQGYDIEAEKLFHEAISIADKNMDARNNLGKLFYARGDTLKAIKQWQYVLANEPKNLTALHCLGLALYRMNRGAAAKRQFDIALDLFPDAERIRSDASRIEHAPQNSGKSSERTSR